MSTNKSNAQHSTGPKTKAGKQKSSLNALRHGLTSQIVVMPTEDLHAYQRHLKTFDDEYLPEGATETHLVQALADAAWRLNRVAAIESNLLTRADGLDLAALESQSKALANLSLHSSRLSRQVERTIAQLRDLQRKRRSNEKQEVDDVLDVLEMYEDKGEPYRPAEDGFVFSKAQLNAGVLARNRERLIDEAQEHFCA
jgi:hypothetical protein